MRCIYCLKPSKGTKGIAHVFPEAVWPKGPSLPLGAVCDKCNGYAGQKLETVLVRHRNIGIILQMLKLPGKKGKTREKLGIYEKGATPDADVTFAIEPPETYFTPEGVQKATIRPIADSGFDTPRFSRALHHIAFNAYALRHGTDAALDERFNAIRNYVRAPVNGQLIWPYIHQCRQFQWFEPGCGAVSKPLTGRELLEIRIFNTRFLVDLLNSGCLLTARIEGPPADIFLVGPDHVDPAPKPPEPRPDGKVRRYRVSLLKPTPADYRRAGVLPPPQPPTRREA